MPTYEFRCSACTSVTAIVMTVKERTEKPLPKCPRCGAEALEPVFGTVFAKTSRKS
jgi:putative FmdB family regulatory protein